MAQMPNNPLQVGNPQHTPASVANTVGIYAQALVRIVFWVVVSCATLGAAFIALRGVWWAAQSACKALGV